MSEVEQAKAEFLALQKEYAATELGARASAYTLAATKVADLEAKRAKLNRQILDLEHAREEAWNLFRAREEESPEEANLQRQVCAAGSRLIDAKAKEVAK